MPQFPEFDLYATLHLSHDATMDDVRTHYIKIMRGNHVDHPDFLSRIRKQFPADHEESDSDYNERISEIAKRSVQRFNVAYEILSNPLQRSAYDRHIAVSGPSIDKAKSGKADVDSHPKTSDASLKVSPAERQFFNRKTQTGQKARRKRSEANTNRDKYCFWKQ